MTLAGAAPLSVPFQAARRGPNRWLRAATPWLLLAPALLLLAVVVIYPIFFNLHASVHAWNLLEDDGPRGFVAGGTFAEVLGEPGFLNALRVTLSFTAAAVLLEFTLGLALALVAHEAIWGQRLIRTLLVAPIMATPLVVALVFRLMWHGEFGVINHYLSYVGIGPVVWLAGPNTAFLAILVTEVWHNTSFVFLVLLGALQMLPPEPFEAAKVDGANFRQRLWHVTLPLLKPAIALALLFRLVFTLRLFDEVWVLTRGGPNGATETVSILLYRAAFEVFDVARAGALSALLLALSAALAWGLLRVLYRRGPA
ncbi:carbohydrate ABC transporter permease [Falsiroseomonas sp. HW251]|uniref:carbohydrate ABC transporter permease n=1 Tax=Falsiroseomonas sp. HW251 TaxID=3390998 RepID=UPI003D31172D